MYKLTFIPLYTFTSLKAESYNLDCVCVSNEKSARAVREVLGPSGPSNPSSKQQLCPYADGSICGWPAFQQEVEDSIHHIPPYPNEYTMFTELLKRSARRHIPRGCQTEDLDFLKHQVIYWKPTTRHTKMTLFPPPSWNSEWSYWTKLVRTKGKSFERSW